MIEQLRFAIDEQALRNVEIRELVIEPINIYYTM